MEDVTMKLRMKSIEAVSKYLDVKAFLMYDGNKMKFVNLKSIRFGL